MDYDFNLTKQENASTSFVFQLKTLPNSYLKTTLHT